MQFVRVPGRRAKRPLDLLDRTRIEQLPQLLDPHQLAQELPVERERLCTSLCRRRVVLVHVGGDVLEEKRGSEGRGGCGLDLDDVELPGRDPTQDPAERG